MFHTSSQFVCLSLVRNKKVLENCLKCDTLEYWGTFHNSFHNLNVTFHAFITQKRMKSLETGFDFISSENYWHPDTSKMAQPI